MPSTDSIVSRREQLLDRARALKGIHQGRALLEIERLGFAGEKSIRKVAINEANIEPAAATRMLAGAREVERLLHELRFQSGSPGNDKIRAVLENHAKDGSIRELLAAFAKDRLKIYAMAVGLNHGREPCSRNIRAALRQYGYRSDGKGNDTRDHEEALSGAVRLVGGLCSGEIAGERAVTSAGRELFAAFRVLFSADKLARAGMLPRQEMVPSEPVETATAEGT